MTRRSKGLRRPPAARGPGVHIYMVALPNRCHRFEQSDKCE